MTGKPDTPLLIAYFRLLRLPLVFTAFADIAMGYLFVSPSLAPVGVFVLLIASSGALYLSGMVLNDFFDRHVDAKERPERPIPSGRVPAGVAGAIGFSLLLVGVALGWCAGFTHQGEVELPWRSGAVATALAACVLLYDGVLKNTWLGPAVMGSCRALNVLLGMSLAASSSAFGEAPLLGYGIDQLLLATGFGIYITGVTALAKNEAGVSRPAVVFLATAIMIGGVVLVALFPSFGEFAGDSGIRRGVYVRTDMWRLLLAILLATVVRRCYLAALDPVPAKVQLAVAEALTSLLVLHAAVVLLVRGPFWAIGILALLLPMTVLRRWVYLT